MKIKLHFPKISASMTVVWANIVATLTVFIVFGVKFGYAEAGGPLALTAYYARQMALSFLQYSVTLYDFFYISFLLVMVAGLLKVAYDRGRGPLMSPYIYVRDSVKKLARAVLVVMPAFIYLIAISFTLTEANLFNIARLHDYAVIGWEHSVFGIYVFAALGAITFPHFLITAIITAFEDMGILTVIMGLCIGFKRIDLLEEMVASFCIGISIMMFFWIGIPALSPQDRFIDNVYHLPVSQQIAAVVADYHPQKEIANFMKAVRVEKNSFAAMPTSTMPSAHVFWAFLVGYYLFRLRKLFGWVMLPYLLLSSMGTVVLAQHYLLDIPVSLIISSFAVWASRKIAEYGARRAVVVATVPPAIPEASVAIAANIKN
jgi:hypothetical protein